MPEKIMNEVCYEVCALRGARRASIKSGAHIASWRDNGFALVHDLLPDTRLQSLKKDALGFYRNPILMQLHTLIILAAVRNLCFRRNQRRVMR